MKAIMTIPSKVFETVKDRVLGTWFKDDEPVFERISTKNKTTICTFETECGEDFDLLKGVCGGYGVRITTPYNVDTDEAAHIRFLEDVGCKFFVEETEYGCSLDGEFNTFAEAKEAIDECMLDRASDTDVFARLQKYYPNGITQIPIYEEFRVWAIRDDNEELLYIRRVKTVYHKDGSIDISSMNGGFIVVVTGKTTGNSRTKLCWDEKSGEEFIDEVSSQLDPEGNCVWKMIPIKELEK